MKTCTKLAFGQMPKDYAGLCRVHAPRVIRDRVDYDNTMEIVEAMVLHAAAFTADQRDYFELLTQLIEEHDAAEIKWPKLKPESLLKHLLAERNLTAADLSRVLGASRNLGAMILRGERRLTLDHIHRLAKFFKVSPALFVNG